MGVPKVRGKSAEGAEVESGDTVDAKNQVFFILRPPGRHWAVMPPEDARKFAAALVEAADDMEKLNMKGSN